MKPENKIKKKILLQAEREGVIGRGFLDSDEEVEEYYSDYKDNDFIREYIEWVREGEVETGLDCEFSRHYESKSVASEMPDGSWVGWTYWYGGGKHGQPEIIPWIGKSYDLEVAERKRTVIVREFKKRD